MSCKHFRNTLNPKQSRWHRSSLCSIKKWGLLLKTNHGLWFINHYTTGRQSQKFKHSRAALWAPNTDFTVRWKNLTHHRIGYFTENWPRGLDDLLNLPFVQHHISKFEVSVNNVFLQGKKTGERKHQYVHTVFGELLAWQESVCIREWHTTLGNQ